MTPDELDTDDDLDTEAEDAAPCVASLYGPDTAFGQLSHRRQRFVLEFLRDGVASQAYLRAGYRAKDAGTASANASRLMSNLRVARAIRELHSERAKLLGVDRWWLLDRFVAILDRCSQAVPVLDSTGA